LKDTYSYSHPPRALQDVKDQGIILERFGVKDKNNRTIAAYRFAAPYRMQETKAGGRKNFSKAFKQALIDKQGNRCAICSIDYDSRLLQIDHRVPYAVMGELAQRKVEDYMLLCGSCNRAKSWSCEHCNNYLSIKDPSLCNSCYWANPTNYQHIALRQIRRLDIVWQEDEIEIYDKLRAFVQDAPDSIKAYIKDVIAQHIGREIE
jgi:hypothetical protein